jgi:hypothetical protein
MSETRRERHEARVDEAIDRAVREMLDVEAPAGLRGRVLQRIRSVSDDSGASAHDPVASAFRRNTGAPLRRKFAWLFVPLAAVAVIILAVLVQWRHAGPTSSRAVPTIATSEARPPIVPTAERSAQPAAPSTGSIREPHPAPSRPSRRSNRIFERVAATDAADLPDGDVVTVTAIATSSLEHVEPIRTQSIVTPPIVVEPLMVVEPVQVEALSPPVRRD